MNTQTQPAAGVAATASTGTPPIAVAVAVAPAGRLDRAKGTVEKVGGMLTVLAGVGGLLAAGAATGGGYVTSAYDWLTSTSQTQSQVTAIDERLKVLEGDKATLAKDREELARLARSLEQTTRDLDRAGVDVRALQDVQRRLEMRVERLDAILDMLRERRS